MITQTFLRLCRKILLHVPEYRNFSSSLTSHTIHYMKNFSFLALQNSCFFILIAYPVGLYSKLQRGKLHLSNGGCKAMNFLCL